MGFYPDARYSGHASQQYWQHTTRATGFTNICGHPIGGVKIPGIDPSKIDHIEIPGVDALDINVENIEIPRVDVDIQEPHKLLILLILTFHLLIQHA